MIIQPEQYEVNKMEKGDIVYVVKQPLWYKFIRKYLLKNKEQITVRTDWQNKTNNYKTYYKEDCILIYEYELLCKATYNNCINYFISYTNNRNT